MPIWGLRTTWWSAKVVLGGWEVCELNPNLPVFFLRSLYYAFAVDIIEQGLCLFVRAVYEVPQYETGYERASSFEMTAGSQIK